LPWRGLAGDIQYPSSARQGLATLPPSPRLWRTGCPKPRRRVRLTFTLAARIRDARRKADADRNGSCLPSAAHGRATSGAKTRRVRESQRRITAFYRPEKRWATHRALCVRSPFGHWPRSAKRRAPSRCPRSRVSHVALSAAPFSVAPLKTPAGRPFPGEACHALRVVGSERPAAARSVPTPPERNTGMKPCPCCAGIKSAHTLDTVAERCGRGNTSGIKSRIVLPARTHGTFRWFFRGVAMRPYGSPDVAASPSAVYGRAGRRTGLSRLKSEK